MDLLWADLINSDWHDYRGTGGRADRVDNEGWLRGFLARAAWGSKRLPSVEQRDELRRFRGVLRRIVDEVRIGGFVAADDVEMLNGILGGAPAVRRLVQDETGRSVVLVPAASGMAQVLGATAASFASMLADGDPTRIKVCANPDCGWVMYDESRNRTRRWCDKTECGNLIKVRSHRRRERASSTTSKT